MNMEGSQQLASKPKRNVSIAIVPVLLVVITFLFWRETWFGRKLPDREMSQYLTDTSVPHKTQHALAQMAERMARGDASVRRWYPQVLVLAGNQEAEFRQMAAWVMGQDNSSQDFHQALRKLLADPQPLVQWNAALALVRFGDASGVPQLRRMLKPYTLLANQGGNLTFQLKEKDPVKSGSVVARIQFGDATPIDVRSPLAGQIQQRVVKDGATVSPGVSIAIISPGEAQVWESLRALYFVGQSQDLEDVERFARGVPGMSDRVKQQAELTAQAIRRRPHGGSP
jgi:hypothetical protein